MKWEVSESKVKETSWAPTQMCVRSAMLPLCSRYCPDLLSLRLCHIKMQCFADALYSCLNSLIGNTCAQLFAGG